MSFDHFTGLFVMHCHRLNHEDNGLMALVNVIPNVSSYAVVAPESKGEASQVKIFDGNGDKLLATVTPFPGYEGAPSVAMGDVDDDGVWDLVVGAGKGHAPEVVAYSGKAADGKKPFATELARFMAFAPEEKGGVSVTSTLIDALSTADDIVVGSPPGVQSEVKVFSSKLPSVGSAPAVFSSFKPYDDDKSGVTLASGFVDFSTGRNSIVTAPGPGSPTQVKVFAYSLFKPIGKKIETASAEACPPPGDPIMSSAFMPFGTDYRGGVSLATGWFTGAHRRRRAHRGRPARRLRRENLRQRLGARRRSRDVSAQPNLPSERQVHRGRELRTVRRQQGRDRRRRPAPRPARTCSSPALSTATALGCADINSCRPTPTATTLEAKPLGDVASAAGSAPNALGGD